MEQYYIVLEFVCNVVVGSHHIRISLVHDAEIYGYIKLKYVIWCYVMSHEQHPFPFYAPINTTCTFDCIGCVSERNSFFHFINRALPNRPLFKLQLWVLLLLLSIFCEVGDQRCSPNKSYYIAKVYSFGNTRTLGILLVAVLGDSVFGKSVYCV